MEQTYWIAGQRITRRELAETRIAFVQSLLKHDHEHGVRPRCLCKTPGVDMVVRKLPSRFVLARMPRAGFLHDAKCDSFDLPAGETGRSNFHADAIRTDATGVTLVHLEEPLCKRRGTLATTPAATGFPPTAGGQRSTTTLLGLLRQLWTQSRTGKYSENGHRLLAIKSLHSLGIGCPFLSTVDGQNAC